MTAIHLHYRQDITDDDKTKLCEILGTHEQRIWRQPNPNYCQISHFDESDLFDRLERLWALPEVCSVTITR